MSQDSQEDINLIHYNSTVERLEELAALFHRDYVDISKVKAELKHCSLKIEEIIRSEGDNGFFLEKTLWGFFKTDYGRKIYKLCLTKRDIRSYIHIFYILPRILRLIKLAELCQLKQHLLELVKFIDVKPDKKSNYDQSRDAKISNETTDKEKQQLYNMVESTVEIPRVQGFKEVAGFWDVKKMLRSLIILPKYQPQLFENEKVMNSLLLFGPPGTGKTKMVHALAYEAQLKLFCVTAGNIMSPYVGQTEKQIKFLFDYIRSKDSFSLLFIDEIDGFCRKRSSSEQESSRRVKTELLCQISQIESHKNVFLICATNCPWDLDTAFLRRFQNRIFIPLPNYMERRELFKKLTRSTPLEACFADWEEIIAKTEGWSGSDITDLVKQAKNIPILELQDTKFWKVCPDGFHEPVTDSVEFNSEEVRCSEITFLPPRSVRARKIQPQDLFHAFNQASPTITESEMKKYSEYC